MYLKKYIEMMERLRKNPIINPTDDDMARLCPHLTKEQAVNAFRNDDCGSFDDTYVACPGLRVRGAFQIVSYKPASGNKPDRLEWSYAGKITNVTVYPYMEEAVRYAEKNWDKYLINDDLAEIVRIEITDPVNLVKSEYHPGGAPTAAMIIMVALNRSTGKMFYDHSRPRSELFDEAIVEMSAIPVIMQELQEGYNYFRYFFCGFCGSGFEASYCPGCDHGFEGGYFGGHESKMALPSKLVRFARENGHVFKKDPKIALETEIKGFRKNQYYWRNE